MNIKKWTTSLSCLALVTTLAVGCDNNKDDKKENQSQQDKIEDMSQRQQKSYLSNINSDLAPNQQQYAIYQEQLKHKDEGYTNKEISRIKQSMKSIKKDIDQSQKVKSKLTKAKPDDDLDKKPNIATASIDVKLAQLKYDALSYDNQIKKYESDGNKDKANKIKVDRNVVQGEIELLKEEKLKIKESKLGESNE